MSTALSSENPTASPRRPDLDALRVGAFLLLIFYHLGMFYVPWGWHVKSTHVIPALEPLMGALNPWRLTLLFVISGAATRFMSARLSACALAASRSKRLLVPLLFGMLVVVAPQSWAEVVEKRAYSGSFVDFWLRYLSFDQSFGLILPTYNHLWFLPYLWLYTMAAVALSPFAACADRLSRSVLSGPGLFVAPALLFGLFRATASRAWGETHIVWADGYAHLQYGAAFFLGCLLANWDEAWALMRRLRLASLTVATVTLTVGLSIAGRVEDSPGWPGFAFAFLREAYAWAAICALFGYANQYIRRSSPALRRLSEMVFPAYIIHQTVIVVAGHLMKSLTLPLRVEASALLVLTLASCVAVYGLALAVPILRLPLGLKAR